MRKKRLVLTFPPQAVNKPLTYYLVKDYDLVPNILRAEIHEEEVGRMLLELEGTGPNIEDGISYLKKKGVRVEEAIKDIQVDEDSCISCGACTAICLPKALEIGPPDWRLSVNKDRCVLCGYCVESCPLQLIKVEF